MMIDIHTHPPKRNLFGESFDPEGAAQALLAEMNPYGISKAGLLGNNCYPFQTEASVREVNDFTLEVVRRHPERFFGFCFINPGNDPAFIREELDRCLSLPEFYAVKLEVCVNCRSSRLDLVMERAIAHRAVVLQHSWYVNTWEMSPAEMKHQANRSEPHDVADLARRFPEGRIIMAHMEGCGVRGILDIAELPNVWVDTSGSQPFSGTLEYAIEILGSERILFGSDLLGRGLAGQLGRIMGTPISSEDRQNILLHNAAKLFSLHLDH